ncbi:MAG TPA: carboxypeptidase-like regulatory domain-containing protein [Gemmatimonadaceae bacterium]|nr:carboxypeptidase-like regulatory domain-containing protein [Gemmatimonadaceae bacterium]
MKRLAMFAAVAVLGLTACDAWLTKPSLYSTVHVVTTRRNGDPVPGVALTLYTGQRPMGYDTTDSAGRFTFTRVPPGLYGVAASIPPGYDVIEHLVKGPVSTTSSLQVPQDTARVIHFTYLKIGPGTITVRVTRTDGSPMPDITVQLFDPHKVDSVATTDSAGRVVFRQVPFGDYGLVVFRPRFYADFASPNDSLYTFYNKDIIVDAGASDTATVALTRCGGYVRARVVDDAGAPVPGTLAVLYTPSPFVDISAGYTGADGRFAFPVEEPCGIPLAIRLATPPGYSASGRGSFYVDDIHPANGTTKEITLQIHKLP